MFHRWVISVRCEQCQVEHIILAVPCMPFDRCTLEDLKSFCETQLNQVSDSLSA